MNDPSYMPPVDPPSFVRVIERAAEIELRVRCNRRVIERQLMRRVASSDARWILGTVFAGEIREESPACAYCNRANNTDHAICPKCSGGAVASHHPALVALTRCVDVEDGLNGARKVSAAGWEVSAVVAQRVPRNVRSIDYRYREGAGFPALSLMPDLFSANVCLTREEGLLLAKFTRMVEERLAVGLTR